MLNCSTVLEEEIVDDIAVMSNEIMEESEEIGQEIMINQGKDTLEENVLQAGKTMQDVENLAVKLLALRLDNSLILQQEMQLLFQFVTLYYMLHYIYLFNCNYNYFPSEHLQK